MARRLVLPALALLVLAGCSTKRYLTIDSDPPGARVWVNGKDEGKTPATVEFVHYGYFDVRLEMPGYEAVQTEVRLGSKIDGYPIVDLPFELAVRRRGFAWKATLQPIPATDDAALHEFLGEARAFRQRTLEEAVPDAPPTTSRARPSSPPPRPGPEAATPR